jgi:hypothetical protein
VAPATLDAQMCSLKASSLECVAATASALQKVASMFGGLLVIVKAVKPASITTVGELQVMPQPVEIKFSGVASLQWFPTGAGWVPALLPKGSLILLPNSVAAQQCYDIFEYVLKEPSPSVKCSELITQLVELLAEYSAELEPLRVAAETTIKGEMESLSILGEHLGTHHRIE